MKFSVEGVRSQLGETFHFSVYLGTYFRYTEYYIHIRLFVERTHIRVPHWWYAHRDGTAGATDGDFPSEVPFPRGRGGEGFVKTFAGSERGRRRRKRQSSDVRTIANTHT